MPPGLSLLDTRNLPADGILDLFWRADRLQALSEKFGQFYDPNRKAPSRIVCCLFFEPSTRTRMSFQTAAYRLGHQVLTMESGSSSLAKGETQGDTVLNIVAMKPDALVIRYGINTELDQILPELKIPVISAGGGVSTHPTQALLDAYTIIKHKGSLQGRKVLIVGDVRYSRVARANFDVLQKLGADIGVCGPESLLPQAGQMPGVTVFSSLDVATAWADVYMGLRIQLERHQAEELQLKSLDDYHRHFGLNRERLALLKKDALIMHPGPINHGVEFASEVLQDPRTRVLDQVSNGVLIRAAVLEKIFEGTGD